MNEPVSEPISLEQVEAAMPSPGKESRRRIKELLGEKKALAHELETVKAELTALKAKETEREQTEAAEREHRQKLFQERAAAFRAQHPDFDEVVAASTLKWPPYFVAEIEALPNGPQLAYELAKSNGGGIYDEVLRLAPTDGLNKLRFLAFCAELNGHARHRQAELDRGRELSDSSAALYERERKKLEERWTN